MALKVLATQVDPWGLLTHQQPAKRAGERSKKVLCKRRSQFYVLGSFPWQNGHGTRSFRSGPVFWTTWADFAAAARKDWKGLERIGGI